MKSRTYTYCVFYLENKYYHTINDDLKKYGYTNVKAIVPIVKLFKGETSRGKEVYKEEPILFNYGFMRIPVKYAYDRQFIRKLVSRIKGVKGFLRSTESLHRKRGKKARVDNAEDFDDFSKVAMVSRKEVKRFLKLEKENKSLSYSDITSIHEGDYIVMNKYPYKDVDAVIKVIDKENDRVKLNIYPQHLKVEIWVPLDMVIYSVYENYNPHKLLSEQSVNPDNLSNNYEGPDSKIKRKRFKTKDLFY